MLISLTLDHRTADLATRERYHLSDDAVGQLTDTPLGDVVTELAMLSTCNRLELYGVAKTGAREATAWRELAGRWMPTATGTRALLRAATKRRGQPAVDHLFRVASGLESQVLGDSQVLGQVRRAYRQAEERGTLGPILHRLFDRALRTAKRVQHETGLTRGRQSVGAEAAQIVARRLAPLGLRRCVVVGCGKTGERAARQLVKFGVADIVLINRTPARASELASQIWGRPASLDAVHREAAEADAVVVATGADRPTLRADALAFCREQAKTTGRPLLLIDLAVPRNIDPTAAELAGVTLIDLDALHPPVASAEALRRQSVPRAESIVETEVSEFLAWLEAAPAREALQPLRAVLQELCHREVAYAAGQSAAEHAADRIVAKLLARPMIALREASERGETVDDLLQAVQRLFAPVPRKSAPRPALAKTDTR